MSTTRHRCGLFTDQMPDKMPPSSVFHATADTTVPSGNSTAFRGKLVSRGNRCEWITFEGLGHSYHSSKCGEAGKRAETETRNDAETILKWSRTSR